MDAYYSLGYIIFNLGKLDKIVAIFSLFKKKKGRDLESLILYEGPVAN